ncbi:DUF692 domain-containing protein [Litoribacillus peritrichatus]|uniref:MNIO family bufferin maturase n=1 Tax=Litoribacillus peritrichatus TaxID=718191 RepID=UPI0031DCC8E1
MPNNKKDELGTKSQPSAGLSALPKTNLGFGVGLRSQHFPYLMNNDDPMVDWFEIISENFIDNYGYGRHVLAQLRAKRPIVMHGVSMNIGSTDPLNSEYLRKLKELAEFIKPEWISDHLCWTGFAGINSHDLLPLPLTDESLNHVISRVNQVQDILERPLVLENPSTYLEYEYSHLSEPEFFNELVANTQCGILLDVNNVYVSAFNHGFSAEQYINDLPHDHIIQMHLAGPTHCGDCLIDTHDQPVPSPVWRLYQQAQMLTQGVSTLLEWDANIPPYPELVAELNKAKATLAGNVPDEAVVTVSHQQTISTPIVI